MSDPTPDERRFQDRCEALGIAATLGAFSPRATLSPCTLASGPGAPASALAATAAAPGPSRTSTAELPRISVDLREGAARPESAVGKVPADFAILKTLGEGGMGRVLLALHRSLGREVAIKTLKEDASPFDAAALLHEARLTGALEHPGIIPVHALGLDEKDIPLLVMKRVEGVTLRVLLDEPSHPGWSTIADGRAARLDASLEILMRVCQSLAFGHSRGIIHRDVKPENIMVGAYGEVYLLDWGVAATAEEALMPGAPLVGTPVYMAPEMVLGDPIDARTDVYLLGATLHEVLTGRPRHEGASMAEVLRRALISAKIDYEQSVAPELAELCNRATSRDPRERPSGADVFRHELSFYLRKRSAMALCDAALARTVALEEKLAAAPGEGLPEDLAAAYKLATEARFGFAESLKEAPSLEHARRGLERCLCALIELELRQGHAESASALLDELGEKPERLLSRIALAREAALRARKDVARLRAIDRDFDPSVSAHSRARTLAVLVVFLVFLTTMLLVPGGLDRASVRGSVYIAALMTGGCIVVMAALWRRLFANLWNRRVSALIFLSFVALLLHRVSALSQGLAIATVLGGDALLVASMFAIAAAVMLPRLWLPSLSMFATWLAIGAFPGYSMQIFSLATIASTLLFMWALALRQSEARAPE